jgi:hypothetical protein
MGSYQDPEWSAARMSITQDHLILIDTHFPLSMPSPIGKGMTKAKMRGMWSHHRSHKDQGPELTGTGMSVVC